MPPPPPDNTHTHTHTHARATWILGPLRLLLTAKLRVKSVRSVLHRRKKNKMHRKQVEIAGAIEGALVLECLEADVVFYEILIPLTPMPFYL